MQITIHPFQKEDESSCLDIIQQVVVDGFVEEGINIQIEKVHLQEELDNQKNRIQQNYKNYFVAQTDDNIVGLIAYLEPCDAVLMALKELKINPVSIKEIVALYVNPLFQRQGIGSLLFSKIISVLKKQNTEYFAISTGYKKGRSFWTKKLGKESVVFPTYYSGWPCSVWMRKVDVIQ